MTNNSQTTDSARETGRRKILHPVVRHTTVAFWGALLAVCVFYLLRAMGV